MPLGMEVGLSPNDCVRWGPSPYPKRGGAQPNFQVTSIVAKWLQFAWIQMPLGMELGLGLRFVVFDVDPATLSGSPMGRGTPLTVCGACG